MLNFYYAQDDKAFLEHFDALCDMAVLALRANNEVMIRQILEELMSAAHNAKSSSVDPIRYRIRSTFSEMESYLEKCASLRFSEGCRDNMSEAMGSLDDYSLLLQQEWQIMTSAMRSEKVSTLFPRVAFVGSGALPVSALILSEKYNLDVVCVDNDEEAVSLSKEIFSRSHSKKIVAFESGGQDFDYSGIDIVFLASLAQPKLEILKQIKKFSVRGVITRDPIGPYDAFYEPVDQKILTQAGFEITTSSAPAENVMHRSLFLKPV